MRLTKKGDLALSTNAIVVLIIAVIILGLIITFVTQGFSSISSKFLAEADKMPDPTTPSAARPVTVSENVQVSTGEQFAFKISVFNAAAATDVTPTIECTTLSDPVVNKKNIPLRGHATWIVIATADAAKGKYICTTTASGASADTVVTVN